jgi:hypothetical protein
MFAAAVRGRKEDSESGGGGERGVASTALGSFRKERAPVEVKKGV